MPSIKDEPLRICIAEATRRANSSKIPHCVIPAGVTYRAVPWHMVWNPFTIIRTIHPKNSQEEGNEQAE